MNNKEKQEKGCLMDSNKDVLGGLGRPKCVYKLKLKEEGGVGRRSKLSELDVGGYADFSNRL